MKNGKKKSAGIWHLALTSFIAAVVTGFVFRYGLISPLPEWLQLQNVRHAHSHLMFFNWATPVPLLLITGYLVRRSGSGFPYLGHVLRGLLILGGLVYPFFLIWGYQPVSIGTASIPVSVIVSGFVMIGWYLFIAGYFSIRRNLDTDLPLLFYDSSLLLLVVSSLGAWGVAVLQFTDVTNPLYMKSMTHFFLTCFTEGWCVLVVLGVIYEQLEIKETKINPNWLVLPIILGVPLTFPMGMSHGLLTEALETSARLGMLVVGLGLSINLWVIIKHGKIGIRTGWALPVGFLMLKVLSQLGAVVAPTALWTGEHNLRILYIHIVLLGFVTLGLFTVIADRNRSLAKLAMSYRIMAGSIVLLVLSLVLLLGFWSDLWLAIGLFKIVAAIALMPALAAAYMLYIFITNEDRVTIV